MKRRIIRRETVLYTVIAIIIILLFLLLGGRRWMTGPMHGQDMNGNRQMEMRSNPD
jgi:hypothetical protein